MRRIFRLALGAASLGVTGQSRAEPLWQRASLDVLALGGVYGLRPAALNRELELRGYSTLPSSAPALGLALHAGYRRLRLDFGFDVSPDELVSDRTHSAELRWVRSRAGAGYRVFLGTTTALVPVLDLVLIGAIVRFEPGAAPFARERVSAETDRFDGFATGFDLGLELEQLLPVSKRSSDASAELGLKMTVRLGYLRKISSGGWNASGGEGPEAFSGPEIETSGPYIRIGFGLATGLELATSKRKAP